MAYSRDQWIEIFTEWEKGSLTREEFCRGKNLPLSTFTYWRHKIRRSQEVRNGQEPLVRISPQGIHSSTENITLIFPGNIRLSLSPGYDSIQLKRLIADIREVL